MRITAIQNCNNGLCTPKRHQLSHYCASKPTTEPRIDTVSFQKNETIKGAGVGALLGLAAIVLTGGAATPLVLGIGAGASGLAGGLLGGAIENAKEDRENATKSKENKESED